MIASTEQQEKLMVHYKNRIHLQKKNQTVFITETFKINKMKPR